ncbi:Choloylglycine hydrolase [Fundidesulfovibrio magnetotacticus]|uniref:Choloylglycine hydrolase n=1 Tax=Fundidesulfovibrio magnetotacticus TaxID=2730080 RepID=A0A6V8LKD4_9BACT|nr:choloylglycine hydrolase family protein [Fundidesulfovibrio magnetotacticus]GFK93163.1 Choloylglycine hydrolase [Fundidesulfovibrio magnetotacticus]
MKRGLFLFCCLVAAVFAWQGASYSCTSIRLKTEANDVVYARTMEFASFKSGVSVVPKGFKYQGTLPDGSQKGMRWTVKYGFVGMNYEGVPVVSDGMNEKGLVVGSLYIPGYVKYQPYSSGSASSTMAQYELNTWLLSAFATVEEVRKGIGAARVCQGPMGQTGATPLHFTVHDATGASLVIEYVDGALRLHDNPIGVLTNAPNFDWMIQNLSNYVNLSPDNAAGATFSGVNVTPFSQGSGLHGLPGDFTSPSRFVRMVALTQSTVPVKTVDAGIALAMTVINNVDIPIGAVRQKTDTGVVLEVTDWAVVADLSRKRYYYRTYENKNWRYVDLAKALAGAKTVMNISIDTPADYPEVSASARPMQP